MTDADESHISHEFVPGKVATHICQAPDPFGTGDRCFLLPTDSVHALPGRSSPAPYGMQQPSTSWTYPGGTDVDEMIEWVRAQLDDDEQKTRACIEEVGSQRAGDTYDDGSGELDQDDFPHYPWGSQERELAYMAGPGHPDDVLATIAVNRRILDEHAPVELRPWECKACAGPHGDDPYTIPCPTVRLLLVRYDTRPGYREEWRPRG